MRAISSQESADKRANPQIRPLMDTISVANLSRWVEKIAIPRHYQVQPAENRAIADYIAGQLEMFGYVVQRQGPFNNIFACPKEAPAEITLVGAHYDSAAETPGADDNASAVAALLGCARAIASLGNDAAVGFAVFNAEEDHLKGSFDFVENYAIPQRLKIRQAHILEMLGFATDEPGSQKTPAGLPISLPGAGNFLGLLGNSVSAWDVDFVLAQAKACLPKFPVCSLKVVVGAEKVMPVLGRSDHVPFWRHGMPAVMWTDTSEFRNPHYHQPTDTPETLNYEFLRQATQLLTACVAEQSGALKPD